MPVAVVTSDGRSWSWSDLFEEFAPAIHSFAGSRAVSSPDDVVQEVFTTAVERFPEFQGDSEGLRSLLFTLAYRRVADEHRSRLRRREHLVAEHQSVPDVCPTIEEVVTGNEAAAEARAALGILTNRERQVIEMRILDETSPSDVASVLGLSSGNVRVIQARALMKVRKYLTSGRRRGLPSIGLLVTLIRSLRGRLGGGDELGRWVEVLRLGGSPASLDATVVAASSGGVLAAGVVKIGFVASLTTATALGSLALSSADESHVTPPPRPAVSAGTHVVENGVDVSVPSDDPVVSENRAPSPGASGLEAATTPSPEPESAQPVPVDPPSDPAVSVPDVEQPSSVEPSSPEGSVDDDSAESGPVAGAPEAVPEGGVPVEETVEDTIETVEDTVVTVVEEVAEPVVTAATETVEDTVEPLVTETTETVVDDVVEPVLEDVGEATEESVETVEDLTDSVVGGLGGLVGG